jgi:anti-sigma B factor antagonist
MTRSGTTARVSSKRPASVQAGRARLGVMSDRLRLHKNTLDSPSFPASLVFPGPVPYAATQPAAKPTLTPSRKPTLDIPLRIDTVERAGSLVLAVAGELDIATSPVLDDALTRARGTAAASIVIDLSAVSFIDSTALHVLIRHVRAEDARDRLHLTRGSPQTRRLFELTGAFEYLPFVPD